MRKLTLLITMLFLSLGMAWAQVPAGYFAGCEVTFTNIQKDGTTKYTLYINGDNELALSTSSAEELGGAAKFFVEKRANNKYSFYNREKKLYMIWRGKGYGYDGDKGVLAEYNATYCDWTINPGAVIAEIQTYYFDGKRDGGSDNGSLVVMKNSGAFDAWKTGQALSDTYSNLYDIQVVNREYVADASAFENRKIYTFVTERGWMGAKDGNNNVISTAKTSHNLTGSKDDANFQWTVYKSEKGNYYLYNIGKGMFMGVQASNNASIPFADSPACTKLTFKVSSNLQYPIMFSTNNSAVVNHSTSYGDGCISWTGGWNTLNDGGSNHKVEVVGNVSDEVLAKIEILVAVREIGYFRLKGHSGNYIDASDTWSNTNQMSMKAEADCNPAGVIFYYDENNGFLNYATGRYINETRTLADVNAMGNTWSIYVSATESKYKLLSSANNWLHDNGGSRADRCSSEGDHANTTHSWILEKVEESDLPGYARIGDTEYETLAEAVAAAKFGDRIELLKSTTDGEYFLPPGVTFETKGTRIVAPTVNVAVATVGDAAYYDFAEAFAAATEAVEAGQSVTITLLANYDGEEIELPIGVKLELNEGVSATNVTVKQPKYVYNFVYNGVVKATQGGTVALGEAFPDITTTLPYGVSATKPDGNVTLEVLENGTVTKSIEVKINLPFEFADSYANITRWYYLKNKGAFYLSHNPDLTYIALGNDQRNVDANNKDAFTWAFVGNPFDGYQIVNKAAGEGNVLSSSTTMTGDNGGETHPVMTKIPVPTGNNELWIPTANPEHTNGFFLAQKGYANNRINNRDNKLAYWTYDADDGSTFYVELRDYAASINAMLETAVPRRDNYGSEANTAVGYVNAEDWTALNSAIAAAQAALSNGNVNEMAAAETALQAAMNREFNTNQPAAGTYYTIVSKHSGYAANGLIGVDANGNGLIWNTNNNVSKWFKFVAAGEGKFYLYNVKTGKYLSTSNPQASTQQFARATVTDEAKAVTITNMGKDNIVKILPDGGAMIHAKDTKVIVCWNNDSYEGASAWTIVEVENPGVAYIDNQNYATLQAAIDNWTEGQTINLLANTDEEIVLPAGVAFNDNGFNAPKVKVAVAAIGNKYYASLAEAVAAAKSGDILTLYADTQDVIVLPAGVTLNNNGFNAPNVKTTVEVSTKAELDEAIATEAVGVIKLKNDLTYDNSRINIDKAIILDLNGKTITTNGSYGVIKADGGCSIKNGNIVYTGTNAVIKVWNANLIKDIEIEATNTSGATIGGIVIQEGSTTRVNSIKDVTIKGAGLTNGIQTYNCGTATENVIGYMENVEIVAVGVAMNIYAPCGTAKNCTFTGGNYGIELWIKGTYNASLDLVNCEVEGGKHKVFIHDEFNNKPGLVNNGTLTLTADADTRLTIDDIEKLVMHNSNFVVDVPESQGDAQPQTFRLFYRNYVEPSDYVAMVGETGFATLEDAFAAAQNGEDVELIAATYEGIVIPAEFTGKLVINGNVVVENANGSAITGENINISGTGTLTAIANGDHAYGIGGDNTKSITIEGVHIAKVQGGHYGEIGSDTKYYKDAPEGGAAIGSGNNGAIINLTNVTIDEALGGSKAAGIGARYHTGVTININGCTITKVEGGATAAAIGGSRVSNGATASEAVTINILESTITEAVGGVYAAGIGSGYDTYCQANQPICTINIDGSTINAQGGQYAAGIGTGYHNAGLAGEIKNSTITAASGDKVYKDSYTSAQDIGFGVADLGREGSNNDSSITYNGTKIALPGTGVAQVGDTKYATLEDAFAAAQNGEDVELIAATYEGIVIPAEFTGKLVINGNVVVENANGSAITGEVINISGNGTLTAIAAGDHAYGIGGDNTKSINIENVHILKVQGGHYGEIGSDTKYYKDAPEGGAAIGSGNNGAIINLTNVTIDEALGGSKAAGIGALYHTGVTINITDCTITKVEGGATAAAIGGSRVSNGATASEAVTINILESTITEAVGGVYAAGIGSGYDTYCQANQPICTINIDGSTINAQGGQYAAGIGTGYHNAGLAGEIKNSTITAASGDKVYKDSYTSAQDIGFGVADLVREGSNNNSSITYDGTEIALPRKVAKIGDVEYLTFSEALAAAQAGETIVLLSNVKCAEKPVFTKGGVVNVDVNGFVFESNDYNRVRNVASADGTVESNNIKFVSGFGWEVYNGGNVEGTNFRVFPTLNEAVAYIPASDRVARIYPYENIKLANDITLRKYSGGTSSTICVDPGYDITLDLNGYTVLQESPAGNPLEACVRGKLILDDTSDAKSGKWIAGACGVTNSNNSWYGNGGPAFYVLDNGVLVLKGGAVSIARNNGVDVVNTGGLIRIDGGSVVVDGATLNVDDTYGIMAWGGSVTVNSGDFVMGTNGAYSVFAMKYYAPASVEVNSAIDGYLLVHNSASAVVNVAGVKYYADGNDYVAPSTADGLVASDGLVFTPVATIGEQSYPSLQAAIEAVQAGDVVTLIADVETADGVVITDKNLTIDLNGKTYTVTEGASTNNRNFKINGASVVTVKNGTMVAAGDYYSGAYGTVRTEGTANVTLTGLKLYNYRGNGLNIKACTGTTVTIENTEIYAQYGGGIEAAGGTIVVNEGVTVEQKGMYTAPYNSMAISVNGGGKVTVNGGTFSTECITAEEANNQGTSHGPWVAGVLNSGGTLIINGGTFSNDNFGENSLATAARGAILADTKAKVEINGGTFNVLKNVIDIQNNLGDTNNNPSVVLAGGTYNADPRISAQYGSNLITLADGYVCQANNDGTFGVVDDPAYGKEAIIGETYYASLAEAVAAAQANDVITLIADVELAETLTVAGKAITLDLNGKTVSGTCNANQASLVYVENNAALTVKDSADNGKITYAKGTSGTGWTVDVKGAFTLESGTIELTGSNWSIGYAVDVRPNAWGTAYTNPTVFTMNGGKLVSSDGAVRVASSSADAHKMVSASFVMNDGTIDAAWDGVFVQQSDAIYDVLSFTMNGGTIESDLNPVRVYGPAATSYVNGEDCMNVTFNGGTMTYTGTETREWVIDGILRVGGGSSLETILESGNITASEAFATASALPEGYEWVADGNGNYVAAFVPKVAKIGETYYATLQAAVEAAQAGETVVVLENVEVASGTTITLDGVNLSTLDGVTLTNNGAIDVKGEVSLNIVALAGEELNLLDGAIVKNSTVGGSAFVAGAVTFRGANTFAMLYDFGTLTDYYGTTAPMKWIVEEGASVTLTDKARYGLGYGDDVTVYGNIENALTARENLTDADRSLFMHGLVAQESKGWNCDSKFTVENAYVAIGSNNSFGNKPGNYGGTYTFNFENSVIDASRITFYEALSTTTFTFDGCDVKMGTFMTRDADSKFTLKNSKVLSTTTTNGNDEGNYNKGELTLVNSSLTYSAELKHEDGVINLDCNSVLTAPAISGAGKITVDATGLEGTVTVINGNMANFTGTIEIVGNEYAKYEITAEGLVINSSFVAELEIIDGVYGNYTNDSDKTVGKLTYVRTLPAAGIWYPVFLPFDVPVSALAANFDVARINDLHTDFSEEDGSIEKMWIEYIVRKSGEMAAGKPFLVRAKSSEVLDMEIELENVTLYASSKKSSIIVASAIIEATFEGVYEATSGLVSTPSTRYMAVTADGVWDEFDGYALNPFRVMMTLEILDEEYYVASTASFSVGARVIGEENEDGTTTIYDVEADREENDMIFDLQGRRVLETEKGGIYIKNGKKFIAQ